MAALSPHRLSRLAGEGGREGRREGWVWRGLLASAVASAAASASLASSLGSQPQECLGPTLWPAPDEGGQWRSPATGIWGYSPKWVAEVQAAALSTPFPSRGHALGPACHPLPWLASPQPGEGGGVWAGPLSFVGSHPPLWAPILASPSPGRARGQLSSGSGGSQRGMVPSMAL